MPEYNNLKSYECMPYDWIRVSYGLKRFKASSLYSFSALKIYLFLICQESPRYNDIERHTFTARGEIKPSLDLLQELNLITVTRSCTGNIYQIHGDITKGYAQVPTAIFKDSLLQNFILKRSTVQQNQRRRAAIDALKLYYLFLAFRGGKYENRAMIGYEKIAKYTGIQKKNIRSSISLLIESDLIICENSYFTLRQESRKDELTSGSNKYFIKHLQPYEPLEGWAPVTYDTMPKP